MEVRLDMRLQKSGALLECMSVLALDDILQHRPASIRTRAGELTGEFLPGHSRNVQAFLATGKLPAGGQDIS